MLAAAGGHLETAQLLLNAGADPNLRGPLGVTALDSAIRNKHGDVALLLLDAGANPNPKLQPVGGLSFMTPLEGAITNEDVELTEALLNKGASVTDLSTKLLTIKCSGGFAGALIQRDPRFEWLRNCQTQSWLSKFRQRF
jgi:ankyrin repeat protein